MRGNAAKLLALLQERTKGAGTSGYTLRRKCAECGIPVGRNGRWGFCSMHYQRAKQRRIKGALVEALGGSCAHCQGVYPLAVYDFHHVGGKDHSAGALISSASLKRIADEIAKCELLCSNCHRIEHHGQE